MQDNVHELITIKPMKVKDYKPLYKTIVLVKLIAILKSKSQTRKQMKYLLELLNKWLKSYG